MSAQSNDIKQLFSHLGLNPGDYLEIRPKPVSNATVARAPVVLPEGLLPTPPVAVAPAPVQVVEAPVTRVTDEVQRTVTLNAPPPVNQPPAENLHSLFQQVKEPLTAGLPAEEEDTGVEQSLKEAVAETRYVPPVPQTRRPPPEETMATDALDAALAKLKDAPPRLQTPPLLAHTSTQAGAGSRLQDVFRRISSKGSKS